MKKWCLLICLVALGAPAWAADSAWPPPESASLNPDLSLSALTGPGPSPALVGLAPSEPWRLDPVSNVPGQGSFLDSLLTPEQMEGVYLDGHEQAKAAVGRMIINLATRQLD